MKKPMHTLSINTPTTRECGENNIVKLVIKFLQISVQVLRFLLQLYLQRSHGSTTLELQLLYIISIQLPLNQLQFRLIPSPNERSLSISRDSSGIIKRRRPRVDSNHNLVISASAAAILVGAMVLCVFYVSRRKKYRRGNGYSFSGETKRCVSMMEYKGLESATDNFRDSNILGVGGFGCVYKGILETGNLSVAVKRLSASAPNSFEDAAAITEFQTEVDLLSKIEHPNIITLLGYSIHAQTRLLVYELMQNGSLDTQLHGPSRGSALTWDLRLKIALDVARGLEYLHEHCNPPVIHRDLKSSNILLDSNFNAKVSDFGLAILDGSQKKKQIKISGTLGYVAPEYLLDGKLTGKSDVYAFGVVLLELLLGRKPMEKVDESQSTVSWAMPQLTDRTKLPNIVDPVISNSMDMKHLYQVAAVALLCIQPEPSYRPLITDILLSLVPLVPLELGGTLRTTKIPSN